MRLDGRVQGVWFRGWTVQEATALGLDGWVRNNFDGTVEAVFSGDARAVDRMVALCRQGPRFARVDSLNVAPAPAPAQRGFRQIRGG
ncbi:MAG: acylphosphatase [Hyphomicrobiales bacterium]|nr:acylphosphatase [Hyphomicrobiales bacterium]MCP5373916.1 acylphosphatase [Hyphomicrobiales bacterium]